ncbi:MAG: hypothetical protein EOO61_23310, partial [Hymenobacter sp.]
MLSDDKLKNENHFDYMLPCSAEYEEHDEIERYGDVTQDRDIQQDNSIEQCDKRDENVEPCASIQERHKYDDSLPADKIT